MFMRESAGLITRSHVVRLWLAAELSRVCWPKNCRAGACKSFWNSDYVHKAITYDDSK